MVIRPLSLTAVFIMVLAGSFALPEPAEAGGRRNYADEWKREEREERRREEREEARKDRQDHQTDQQNRYLDHDTDRQKRHINHRERQLDRVIDHVEGKEGPAPAAPAPRKKRGTCIYGEGNKVLYQPDGVVCDH